MDYIPHDAANLEESVLRPLLKHTTAKEEKYKMPLQTNTLETATQVAVTETKKKSEMVMQMRETVMAGPQNSKETSIQKLRHTLPNKPLSSFQRMMHSFESGQDQDGSKGPVSGVTPLNCRTASHAKWNSFITGVCNATNHQVFIITGVL